MDLHKANELIHAIRKERFENKAGYLKNFAPFIELESMVLLEIVEKMNDAPVVEQDETHQVPF